MHAPQLTPQESFDCIYDSSGAVRILLRRAMASDIDFLMRYAGDRRVAEATRSIPHPLSIDDAATFLKRASQNNTAESIWIIDGSDSALSDVLGVINLKRMDEDRFNRDQSEVSFWVAPEFWNLGVASCALRVLLSANPHASKAVFAEVFQDNLKSAHVLTNAGFKYLGEAESFCTARQANIPTWTYIRKLA